MLLNVDPFNHQSRHIDVPIKALGDIIESVGTPHFVHRLTSFMNGIIPLDVVHVERSRFGAAAPLGYSCEWLGSGAVDDEQAELDHVMGLYYERYQAADPLFAAIRGTTGTHLVVRDMSNIPAGEFRKRIFDERQIAHECVLTKDASHAQYSLAIVRRKHLPAFSLSELSQLRHLGDFLFPLLELHSSMSAARKVANTATSTDRLALFDARVAHEGITLSKREYESCKHLIVGRTVPETAAILGVRQSSAESYIQRAFAKLGVRTKRDLAKWALEAPAAVAVPNPAPAASSASYSAASSAASSSPQAGTTQAEPPPADA